MRVDDKDLIIKSDEGWMQESLALARKSESIGEIPVGAIVVLNGEIIGRGYNQSIAHCDPCAHAEIIALRDAAKTIGNYRLIDAELFVTLEPCTMCVGAIIHSRVRRVVYGAKEPKSGVVESRAQLLDASYLNYKVESIGGVCEEECSTMISHFFAMLRAKKKNKAT